MDYGINENEQMTISFLWRWLVIWWVIFPFTTLAYDIPINISGQITIPACVVNNGEVIDVNFGNDLLTTRVKDGFYSKSVKYSFKCFGSPSNNLRMKITGEPSSFDTRLLKTSNANLGILLSKELSPFPLNQWVYFPYQNDAPLLQAALVSLSGETLSPGAFNGTATLMIDYQ
ncbi:fimbrial protein [Serratia marcescens]|uniref:fimbrial protein n=1 Tax=Serratia marcescens TaxID=615 RepID=UPI00098ECD02|nr:fimbrial protein [Serratia marcescens]